MSVSRDVKDAYSQRPRASISKPSSGTGTPSGTMWRATSGNDEVIDLDFIAGFTPLLGNSGFRKAKGIASVDGVAVLQQPLHRAAMEHRPSLSASVFPTAATASHTPNSLPRALANAVGQLGRWKRALNPESRRAGNPVSTTPQESRRLVCWSYVPKGICSTFVVEWSSFPTCWRHHAEV